MKHNKKRNTAFIYETLSRELTKAIVDKDKNRKTSVVSIVKEHFSSASALTKAIFDSQSQVIATINKNLGKHVWSNFVPNFKSLASVNAIFNTKMPIKTKVLFEQQIIEKMTAGNNLDEELKTIDNLTYHSFIKKFNNKYTDLLQEQKDLIGYLAMLMV